MFVAHHRRQGCSTHSGKSHLKEGANATGHFRSIPVVTLWKEFGHRKASGEPSHTHRENQGAHQVADGFGLTCVPVRRGISKSKVESSSSLTRLQMMFEIGRLLPTDLKKKNRSCLPQIPRFLTSISIFGINGINTIKHNC